MGRFDEAAVLALNEQSTRKARTAANEDIVETVAVHIRHREGRPLPRQLVRQQRLYVVVERDEIGLLVRDKIGGLEEQVSGVWCQVPGGALV